MLEFGSVKLADGEDREITRTEIKRITGLTDARLSQLRDELPALARRHSGKAHYNTYSLRMVLEYCTSGRMYYKPKNGKGKQWRKKA